MRRLLWLLGLLYVLYLLAGNAFINSPLARAQINRKPQTIQVQWSWAWTVWPGQVGVHSLQVHGHARKLLWAVDAGRASGRVLWGPLFRRELRFGPIQAHAVVVDVQPTAVDHRPPPWRNDAWRVTFDGIHTSSLRQARLGELVIEGKGAGHVGFTHQLRGGPTEIFPSQVTIAHGRLSYGQQPWLRETKLDLRFAVDAFTHDQPAGWRKVQRATGRRIVEGATLPGVARTGQASPGGMRPAAGRLRADVRFDHGSLLRGGAVQWNGRLATVEADGTSQEHLATWFSRWDRTSFLCAPGSCRSPVPVVPRQRTAWMCSCVSAAGGCYRCARLPTRCRCCRERPDSAGISHRSMGWHH